MRGIIPFEAEARTDGFAKTEKRMLENRAIRFLQRAM
jgi:hypothetical protein